MREPRPLDDETLAALEAIDATLHGEPVDPDLADFAELSLILRDERPQPTPSFLTAIDARAAGRFATPPRRTSRRPTRRSPRAWWGVGSAVAAGAAVLVVLLLTVHPGRGGGRSSSGAAAAASSVASASSASSASSNSSTVAAGAAAPPATNGQRARVPSRSPAPRSGRGRDVTQSAQLVLRAQAGRIDPVAQEVFNTIGAAHGVVVSSHVSDHAHGSGAARFVLQVPGGRLQATLTRLSSLRGAQVSSRVDASADITGDVNATAGRLAAAHALRRSLLAQLAAADTTTLAARLQTSLRRNESQIVVADDALARLRAKVSDATVDVSVTAAPSAAPRARHPASAGFTIARALRDAGRVLTVAAGVALIALAVLVPLGLLIALGSWVWALTLHRRRDRVLGP
jgi:hypothetical protein